MNQKSFLKEIICKATRSSGKGGQNVNKVSSRIEADWHVQSSLACNDEEKEEIFRKLKTKISDEGFLKTTCQQERSQLANKKIATEKLLNLVLNSLVKEKKRIATKVSAAKKEKRLKEKKHHAEIKELRVKIRI